MKNDKYVVICDNTLDMPEEFIKENGLDMVSLYFEIDGEIHKNNEGLSNQDFYNKMRDGASTKTMAANPDDLVALYKKYVSEGLAVIMISLSSGISGSYTNCELAKSYVLEEYPNAEIYVIDSLCASGGFGMLVYRAKQNMEAGLSAKENYENLEKIKHNIVHKFTVEDLKYLMRGGRISKASAIIGTLINIKPVLHVDEEGKLVALGKVRGRKKSINEMVDDMENCMGSWKDKEDLVVITHGDCEEDALYAKELIEKKYGIKNFMIAYVSPTIGAHSGPGTLAIFFMGDKR